MTSQTGRLAGRSAMITGAGQNIGRAIAERFAAEGAAVGVVDIEPSRAERVAAGITGKGGRAIPVVADVTDERAVAEAVAHIVGAHGKLDILVNNVAATVNKGLFDTSLEEWDRVLAVTLRSAFLCAKHAAAVMVERGRGGAIVNVASTSGHRGIPNKIAYAAAKGGILNLTRAMAMELAPYGIRVNSLTPTQTGSPVGVADDEYGLERTGVAPGIPLGRFGRPSEQAAAALFLVSDEASFVTGADLVCDGGLLAVFPKSV